MRLLCSRSTILSSKFRVTQIFFFSVTLFFLLGSLPVTAKNSDQHSSLDVKKQEAVKKQESLNRFRSISSQKTELPFLSPVRSTYVFSSSRLDENLSIAFKQNPFWTNTSVKLIQISGFRLIPVSVSH